MTPDPPRSFDLTAADLEVQDRWLRALVRRLANPADVDDVVQDTWVAALSARLEPLPPRAWLSVSAANFARRAHRSCSRRATREREAARSETVPSSEDSLALIELHEEVLRSVRALRPPYQRAIVLRYTHGLSIAEIAAETDTSEVAVRQRLKRGLDQLREALGQRRGEDWRTSPALMTWLAPGALEMKRNTGLVLLLGALASTSLFVALGGWPIGGPSTAPVVVGPSMTAHAVDSATGAPTVGERATVQRQAVDVAPDPSAREGAPAQLEVHGLVVALSSGRPLHGVGVAPTMGAARVPSAGLERPAAVTTTDESGGFRFDNETDLHGLVTDAAWVPVGIRTSSRDEAGALLLVAPAITWRGVILGPAQEPLTGVSIEVEGVDLRHHHGTVQGMGLTRWLPSTTDAAGHFERHDLPAELGQVRFTKEGYRSIAVPLGSHDEPALSLTLALDELEYLVTGHVLAPNGAPLEGARVGIGERVVTTAAYGAFEHRIPSESAPTTRDALWVASPPYETIVVRGFGAELLSDEDHTVTRDLTFRGEALELGGVVVDAAGNLVVGCSVHIWEQSRLIGTQSAEELALAEDGATLSLGSAQLRVWSRTDEGGRFLLRGLRDTEYLLRVMNGEKSAGWTSAPIRAGTQNARLELPPDFVRETVTGRVVDQLGQPVAGAVLSPMVWQVIVQPGAYASDSDPARSSESSGEHVVTRALVASLHGLVVGDVLNGCRPPARAESIYEARGRLTPSE